MTSRLLREDREGLCTLTLNRPDKLNALDGVFFDELEAVTQQLEQQIRDTTQSVEQEIQALGNEASESIQGSFSTTDSPPSPPVTSAAKADTNESGDTPSKTA